MQICKAIAIIILASSYIRANDYNSINLIEKNNNTIADIEENSCNIKDIRNIYIFSHNEIAEKLKPYGIKIQGIIKTIIDKNDSGLDDLYIMALTQSLLMDENNQIPGLQNLATCQVPFKNKKKAEKDLIKTIKALSWKLEKENNENEKIKIEEELKEKNEELDLMVSKRSKDLAAFAYEALMLTNLHNPRIIYAMGCLRVIQDNSGIETFRMENQIEIFKDKALAEKFLNEALEASESKIDSPIQTQEIRIRIACAIECLLRTKPSIYTVEIAKKLSIMLFDINKRSNNLKKDMFMEMLNDLSYIANIKWNDPNISYTKTENETDK